MCGSLDLDISGLGVLMQEEMRQLVGRVKSGPVSGVLVGS